MLKPLLIALDVIALLWTLQQCRRYRNHKRALREALEIRNLSYRAQWELRHGNYAEAQRWVWLAQNRRAQHWKPIGEMK